MPFKTSHMYYLDRLAERVLPLGMSLAILSLVLGHSIDGDTWWHLADGRWMVENHRILYSDPFSYTRTGAPWAHPGYLYEVLLYLVDTKAGKLGVDLLAFTVLVVTFLLIWKVLQAPPLRKLFLIAIAIVVSSSYWSARPNLFSLLFSVISIGILESYRSGRHNKLWLLPLVTLVWSNLHGGFPLAFIFLGIYSLDFLRNRKCLTQFIGVFWLMALSTLMNPYGLGVYGEMLTTSARTAERMLIQEWQSPNFHQAYGMVFFTAALLTTLLMAVSKKPLSLPRLLLPLALLAMAFYSARNIAIFGVLLPIVWNNLLPLSAKPLEPPTHPRPWLTGLSLGLLVFTITANMISFPEVLRDNFSSKDITSGAVDYIRAAHPSGNLFNHYNSGGYLIWALPEYPVFVDSRSDIYGDEIILQSITIESALPGWQKLLTDWKIRIALVGSNSALSEALRGLEGWKSCYRDENFIVFLQVDACPVVENSGQSFINPGLELVGTHPAR
jgi:hypothetical protein